MRTTFTDAALVEFRRAMAAIMDACDIYNRALPDGGSDGPAHLPGGVVAHVAALVVLGPAPNHDDAATMAALDDETSDPAVETLVAAQRPMFRNMLALEVRTIYEQEQAGEVPTDDPRVRDCRMAMGFAHHPVVQQGRGVDPDDVEAMNYLIAHAFLTESVEGGLMIEDLDGEDEGDD